MITGRPDVAVLGLPLAGLAAVGMRAGDGQGRLDLRLTGRAPGGSEIEVALSAPADAELVVLVFGCDAEPPRIVVLAADRRDPVPVVAPLFHTGPQVALRVHGALVAPGGSAVLPLDPAAATAIVAAPVEPVPALALPPLMSLRPGRPPRVAGGEGVEFRDLHPFTPGDRLRRIDWRASARQPGEGALVVRRTEASAEAAAALLLDSRLDVGAVVAEWYANRPARKGRGALDIARSAVQSLTAAYVAAGDRVAFHDLGRPGPGVPSGGGHRQRDRITAVVNATGASSARYLVLPALPPAAVVWVLSTFLDEEPMTLVDLVRATGGRVVAVDVLPVLDAGGLDRPRTVALRLVVREREARLERLRRAGVSVIPWDGERAGALAVAARPRRAR